MVPVIRHRQYHTVCWFHPPRVPVYVQRPAQSISLGFLACRRDALPTSVPV